MKKQKSKERREHRHARRIEKRGEYYQWVLDHPAPDELLDDEPVVRAAALPDPGFLPKTKAAAEKQAKLAAEAIRFSIEPDEPGILSGEINSAESQWNVVERDLDGDGVERHGPFETAEQAGEWVNAEAERRC